MRAAISCFFLILALQVWQPQFAAAEKLPIFVSIPPQAFFVERIGGDRVEVEVMVQPGQSPHAYAPTPRQMVKLAGARVYFRIGAPFENSLLPKLAGAAPNIVVVDTIAGIHLELMTQEHEHGHEADHEHGELDTHTWLAPMLAKQQAAIMHDALCRLAPDDAPLFTANFTAFAAQLDALHARLLRTFAPLQGKSFFVFHPAFGYFAKAYGLIQVAVETGGKQPNARDLARLIDQARGQGVKVLFVQPQFSSKSAETIARAIDGVVIPLDPLARNYLDNMERIAAAMEKALAGKSRSFNH